MSTRIIGVKINADISNVKSSMSAMQNSVKGALSNVKNSFKSIDNGANSAGQKVSDSFINSFAKVAVAAQGLKTVFNWGSQIAQTAADSLAMQAQFEQVFTGIGKEAEKSMENIADSTGMLPNRLKGSFTQMAAFAKTTGLDTADALKLTERATLAASDSAAFYDKSIEEVSATMQSFLKGKIVAPYYCEVV